MPIRPLPPLLINQIAAGEVVERPANVAKELVENAIDAGATRIEVLAEGGGRDRLRVIDDGCGIPFEELPLAVAPHATSKISEQEDLDRVASMGFRGEALASIGAVSSLRITSRTATAEAGGMLHVDGDVIDGPSPVGTPPGTTVDVRGLFSKTPARRKFLKSDGAETRRIREIVQRVALAHAEVGFTVASGDRVLLELAPREDPALRVLDVLGSELSDELLEVDAQREGVSIWGLIGRPAVARPTARHLQLFLNGRPIVDRSLAHAVREAYRGLIDPGRTPTAVLFLTIDPARVDVNVHPTKSEVRFRDDRLVYSIIQRTLLERLSDEDLTATFRVPTSSSQEPAPSMRAPSPSMESWTPPRPEPRSSEMPREFGAGSIPTPMREPQHDAPPLLAASASVPVLQVHGSYLVAEDDDGVLIIDQHALHERIMFSTLLDRVTEGVLDSQRMLTPIVVDVDAMQLEGLDRIGPLLARLGIEAEPIGPSAVGIHGFPVFLLERRVDPGEFMGELLAKAGSGSLPVDDEAALQETLDMMSCRAAVKAGDRLNDLELTELLRQRELVERSSRCPHGRPTTLRLSLEDLEKQFGRR
ncbi:MAG: DNA mismatch repair endonuclease MutL [Phycisphaerales bacterium]|nr:DNA mismatch repair endonuclease MutL [Phycisphaerales bacterium]